MKENTSVTITAESWKLIATSVTITAESWKLIDSLLRIRETILELTEDRDMLDVWENEGGTCG